MPRGNPGICKSEEHKTKIKLSNIGKNKGKVSWNSGLTSKTDYRIPRDSSHPNWKGGSKEYCHKKARELFETELCEICNSYEVEKKNGKTIKLSMHCIGGKNTYINLVKSNWLCVCSVCHKKKLDAN